MTHRFENAQIPRIINPTYRLIFTGLKNISQNREKSIQRRLQGRVPQRTILSLLLFNVYAADIPRLPYKHLTLNADHIEIATRSKIANLVTRKFQVAIDKMKEWCIKWKIVINAGKGSPLIIK